MPTKSTGVLMILRSSAVNFGGFNAARDALGRMAQGRTTAGLQGWAAVAAFGAKAV
jgi:hypothetical protein